MAEEATGGEREGAQETLEETDIAAARHALQAPPCKPRPASPALQAPPCKRPGLQAAWPASGLACA